MSEKIIEFEKTEDWYIRQSENWSKRGDAIKSLLYINMPKSGSRKVTLRKAAAYYESGNFTPAAEILTDMYRSGDRSGEVYALLIKTLTAMSRYRSALYFLNDAAENGAFGFADKRKITNVSDFYRVTGEIKKRYPDFRSAGEVADLVYLLDHGVEFNDETLFGDMFLSEKEVACPETLFKATGVLTPSRMEPSLADKLLGACENNVFSDSGMPRYDVLSAEIIALVSLGRTEEARMRADELLSYDLPENDVDLLKCSEAFIAARCHDGAREYLEELETFLPTETVLLKAATANYATGDYFAARDELSRLLTVYPHNITARRLLRMLPDSDRAETDDELPAEEQIIYSDRLPAEDESEVSLRVEKMLNFAAMRGGIPENADMENNLTYVLRYADDEYADYVCEELARTGMYTGLLKKYLLGIEGSLERKRAILYAFCVYGTLEDDTAELFVYGYKKVTIPDFARGANNESLTRAYYYAYATYCVYGDVVPEKLNDLFFASADALAKYGEENGFVFDAAAAFIEVCGIDCVFGGMLSKNIGTFADRKKTAKYVKIIEEAAHVSAADGGDE